jgi:hypothetical protein
VASDTDGAVRTQRDATGGLHRLRAK